MQVSRAKLLGMGTALAAFGRVCSDRSSCRRRPPKRASPFSTPRFQSSGRDQGV